MPTTSLPIPQLLQAFALALLISALGFRRVVYFISVGYAFSIVAMSVVLPILYRDSLAWVAIAQNLLLFVWGVRLGVYLVQREFQPSYRRELVGVAERSAHITGVRKILIWVGVSLLYVAMFAPALFTLADTAGLPGGVGLGVQIFGLLVMAGGLGLEALADKQKSNYKALFPHRFCDTGVYKFVRYPNYLGEILFWVGTWVVGIPAYRSWLHWVIGLAGLVCIVLIMLGSTKRLEEKQGERYGSRADYQTFIRTVPVLFPFVPVYTLKNIRVYLE
ncbi:MAG: DUF1295 domain-containing protein [Caldilineaceae bacterium]